MIAKTNVSTNKLILHNQTSYFNNEIQEDFKG